jgi:histidine phosphotransferase ChpT
MNSPTGSPISVLAIERPAVSLPRSPAGETDAVEMRILELLTSRLCHEISGPIAAINNGIELLVEEDADFQRVALALIGDSARRASLQLQFYRFAYGFSRGGTTVGAAPPDLANLFFSTTRIACNYDETVRLLPLASQKLACNLLLVGAEALARGGDLTLSYGRHGLELQAVGEGVFLKPEIEAALLLATPVAALTSRTVQAYFTAILADTLGCRLIHSTEPRRFQLTAVTLTG